MASNTMKLLFLLSFSLFVASCGGDKDKESKSTTPTPSTKKPDPDQDDPVVPLTQKDKLDIGAETYALFQKIAKDDPKKMEEINKLLGAVDAIFKDQTTYDTLAKRDEAIDDLDIPNALGGMDVAAIRAALKTKLKADKDLPPGTASLKTFAKSGLAKEPVHNAIVEKGANGRGTRSDAELNALMVAVQDAIRANPNPNAAQTLVRNAAIEDAVVANGGATNGATDAAYKAEIIRVVNIEHPELLLDPAASGLAPLTHGAVANTAHPALTVGQRNALMPLVLAAVRDPAHKFTTATRKAAVEAAVRNVRALGAAVFTPEDTALITAIMAQLPVPGEYPIVAMLAAESGLDEDVFNVINAAARSPEQKNGIILELRTHTLQVNKGLRDAAIVEAINANGAADPAFGVALIAIVDDVYFNVAFLSLPASGLDAGVYSAIRRRPAPITLAQKAALIGANAAAPKPIKEAMDLRPRDHAARLTRITAAVNAAMGGAGDAAWITAINTAANIAQPADLASALPASPGDLLDGGIYDAVFGSAGTPGVPKYSNEQMLRAMPELRLALKERVEAQRDEAIKRAIRIALALDPAAVLAGDESLWYTTIRTAVEAFSPANGLPNTLTLLGASNLPESIYNVLVNDDFATNAQLNTLMVGLRSINMVRVRVNANRNADIETQVKAALGLAGDVMDGVTNPRAFALSEAIKVASATYFGADIHTPGTIALHQWFITWARTKANVAPIKTNTQINTLLDALVLLVPNTTTHQARIDGVNAATAAFGGLVEADKVELLRKLNEEHALTILPPPAITAEVTEARAATGAHPAGFIVEDAAAGNAKYFLPETMLAGLPISVGDNVMFNTVSAAPDYQTRAGIVGFGRVVIKSVTAPIVNYEN